jgi:hypothetical protein
MKSISSSPQAKKRWIAGGQKTHRLKVGGFANRQRTWVRDRPWSQHCDSQKIKPNPLLFKTNSFPPMVLAQLIVQGAFLRVQPRKSTCFRCVSTPQSDLWARSLLIHEKRYDMRQKFAQLIENGKAVRIDIPPIVDFFSCSQGAAARLSNPYPAPKITIASGTFGKARKLISFSVMNTFDTGKTSEAKAACVRVIS